MSSTATAPAAANGATPPITTSRTAFPADSLAAGALQSAIPFEHAHSVITRPRSAEEEAWLQVAREVSAEFALTVDQRYKERASPRPQLDRLLESGLASILIRKESGGGGGDWALAIEIIREIAAGDGSLGVLLMHHLLATNGLHRLPEPVRTQRETEVTQKRFWLGNGGVNPLDKETTATPIGGGRFLLNGRKTFCTGGAVADRVGLIARRTDNNELIGISISPHRPGIKIGHDWDAIGLPLADSGSFTYENAEIGEGDYTSWGDGSRSNFGALIQAGNTVKSSHLGFSNVYLGIAIGSLRAARRYIHEHSRPWITSGVEKAWDDPHVIYQFGEYWARIEAAIAVSNSAAARSQRITDSPREEITEQERGETAIAIATFNVLAFQASVDVTSKLFDWTGARSSAAKYGFDRFWRDARTYALHHPYNYKVHEVGDYGLNGRFPPKTFYS
jgi:alkylation response protein AidB-like acyl-CoA dehydrogenase